MNRSQIRSIKSNLLTNIVCILSTKSVKVKVNSKPRCYYQMEQPPPYSPDGQTPPQHGYAPPPNTGYPPQSGPYPPQHTGYQKEYGGSCPPQNPGYPPQNPGYPPQGHVQQPAGFSSQTNNTTTVVVQVSKKF